ncbi:MAG TPA: hypothetical protein VE572_01995 [Nitrososphaeraceae archaeon]|nr:hypothetical protein [Nitrososphaeraceae archaeon]
MPKTCSKITKYHCAEHYYDRYHELRQPSRHVLSKKWSATIISSTIMSTIISYMMQNFMQKGLGSFMNSAGADRNSMQSSFSELEGGLNDPRHPLVQQVKQNCGFQDDNQARMYTQQATGLLRVNANNDPQGLSSIFGSFG